MASLSLDTEKEKLQENITCHLLPCKVSYNGPCNVSNFFTPYIRKEENHLKCSLRGHPLRGQNIVVPDGYFGAILKVNKKLCDEKHDLKLTGTFKEFTSWNWDKKPSTEDKLIKALQWIKVASVLHKPVSQLDENMTETPKTQIKRKLSDCL